MGNSQPMLKSTMNIEQMQMMQRHLVYDSFYLDTHLSRIECQNQG